MDVNSLTPEQQREVGLAVGHALRELIPTWVGDALRREMPAPDDLNKAKSQ